MDKKNIMIIIPQLTKGGAERIASNLSLGLIKNYNVFICLLDQNRGIDYSYAGEIIDLKAPRVSGMMGKLILYFRKIQTLRKLKQKKKIHISISFLEKANFFNILTKKQDRCIISIRNFLSKGEAGIYGYLTRVLIKILYNKADIIVANSKGVAQDLMDFYRIKKSKIKIIYNFYFLGYIQKKAAEKVENRISKIFTYPVIINIGKLSRQKGQWHLIRIYQKIKQTIPSAKLLILGEPMKGDLKIRDYLLELASDYNLKVYAAWENNDNISENFDIYFLGFQSNPFQYIMRSSVYVFPSLWEGFPNALFEAMICGIPVMSADCRSGPREILAPDTDFMVETKNTEYVRFGVLQPVCDGVFYNADDPLTRSEKIWAESLSEFLGSKQLCEKYSSLSQKRIQELSHDKVIKEWERLFK